MKVAVIHNKDATGVINQFGMQNRETYNPKTVEAVASALERGGHNVRIIDGNMNLVENLQEFMPRVVDGGAPGMVFNMAYGIQGVSRYTHIPSMLEMLGVPYIGSSPAGHGIALDKVTTKVILQHHQVPTPRYWSFVSEQEVPDDLPFPLIVKPKMEAVSMGLEIVHSTEQVKEAVSNLVNEYKQAVLVEEFVPGREFAVGLLGNRDPEVLPIVEIDLKGDKNAIQSITDKKERPRGKICPAEIPEAVAQQLRNTARNSFLALGLYDFARVDYRMDTDNKVYVLELNSMASLGSTGSYVTAAKAAGYDFDALVNRILDVAVVRYFGRMRQDEVQIEENKGEKKRLSFKGRVRSYMRGNLPTIEDKLEKLVELNTFYRDIESVNSAGRWISNQLAKLGFHRQVIARAEFGNILLFSNHDANKNDVLLLGNLDSPISFRDHVSFREERGRIYGTGVSSGKGGIAVMLGALGSLKYTRALKKAKVGILLIPDETIGARSSREVIESAAKQSKYVLGLHGAGPSGELLSSSSGAFNYSVEISRRIAANEGVRIPQNNVIEYAVKQVQSIKKLADETSGIEAIITSFDSKNKYWLAPDHVQLKFSVRFRSPDSGQKIEEKIGKLFTSKNVAFRVSLTRESTRKAKPPAENRTTLFSKIEGLAKKIEVRVKNAHSDAPSSLCHLPEDVPALDGFGPVSTINSFKIESILKDSLIDRSVLLAAAVHSAVDDFNL